jgi:hypothetical protein
VIVADQRPAFRMHSAARQTQNLVPAGKGDLVIAGAV